MSRLLPLFLLLALAPPDDPGQVSLAPDAEARWVPFALTPGNQIRFTALLEDRPVEAVLDTGASATLVAPLASTAPIAGGQAIAVGGTVAIGTRTIGMLSVGGLARRGGSASVAPLPALATGGGSPVVLLVGADLLAHAALEIDYAARRFRLLPSGRLPFTGVTVPLRHAGDRGLYESELTLGGRRVAPAIVDTGDGAGVTVTDAAWRAAGVRVGTTDALSHGVGGPVVTGLAIVPALSIGTLVAHEVEVRIEPAGGFDERVGAAARIGGGLLARYHVLLDPGAGRMVLAPGLGAAPPAVRATAGMLLRVGADRLTVLHVMRGGPAAAAGWRVGDTICRVDGQPIGSDYAALPRARWPVGTPGTTVRLGICDGSERRLTLRLFY